MIANFPDDSKSVLIFPIAQKTGIFGSETPFSYISALFGPLYGLFGPYLIHKHRFSSVG